MEALSQLISLITYKLLNFWNTANVGGPILQNYQDAVRCFQNWFGCYIECNKLLKKLKEKEPFISQMLSRCVCSVYHKILLTILYLA